MKKTYEIIFAIKRNLDRNTLTASMPDVQLIESCKLLGIYFDCKLRFDLHVEHVLTVCNQRLYLLKLLKNQGLSVDGLHAIYNALIISKVLYCLPVGLWGELVKEADI